MLELMFDTVVSTVGKGKNAVYQYLLLFPWFQEHYLIFRVVSTQQKFIINSNRWKLWF